MEVWKVLASDHDEVANKTRKKTQRRRREGMACLIGIEGVGWDCGARCADETLMEQKAFYIHQSKVTLQTHWL